MMTLEQAGISNGLTTLPPISVTLPTPVVGSAAGLPRVVLSVPGLDHWNRPRYVLYLERELNRVALLSAGWDGAKARAVTDAALREVARILGLLVGDDTLLPQVFPLVDGGIQVEWHAGGDSVEVEIEGDGSVGVFAGRRSGETLLDGTPGEDLPQDWQRLLRTFLQEMASNVCAVA